MDELSPRLLQAEIRVGLDELPSLLNEKFRRLYAEDEARAEAGKHGWLRQDYRIFLNDYLSVYEVRPGQLAAWLGVSGTSVTHLLKPSWSKPSSENPRLRVTCPRGPVLEKLLEGLELLEEEVRLFRLLVNLEAARRSGGDADFFKRLIESAWAQETSYLPREATVAYAREFLNMVVREMVALAGFRPEAEWIRAHLVYPLDRDVPAAEIKRTWDKLVALKVVSLQAGSWRLGPRDLTLSPAGAEGRRTLRALFAQGQDAGRAALALETHRRQFESRTVCVPRDRLAELAVRFGELLDTIEEAPEGEGELVLHVQLAAFPVADVNGRGETTGSPST